MVSGRTVLVVATAEAAGDGLTAAEPSLSTRRVGDDETAAEVLDAATVDCVVTDHDPPAVDAPTVVRAAVECGVPAVVATAAGSEALAGEVVAAGAAGYVPTAPTDPTEALVERVLAATDGTASREDAASSPDRVAYETIMETVPEGIFVLDADGVAVTGNREGARMLGCTYEELLGTQIADLVDRGVFDESVVEEYVAVVRDLLSGETATSVGVLEFEAHPDDDETRTYEARIALRPLDESETFRGVIGVIRDVTERERRLAELQRYEAIITSLGDPVWAVDPDGYGTYVNPAYEEQFGWTQEEAGEIHFTEVIADEDVPAIRDLTEELLSEDSDKLRDTLEVTFVTRDGRRVPVEDHFALLPTDGEFRGMAGVARDISDRKRRTRRIQVLNRVLRHNLGNDMNVVAGTAARIAEAATDPEQVERAERIRARAEDLVEVSRTVRRMEGVIDHDRSDRRPIDVVRVLEAAVDELRWRYPEATFDVTAPDSLSVSATEGLQHAVEEVLENAVEHGSTNPPSQARADAVEHSSTNPRSQAREDAVEHGSTSSRPEADDAVEHSSTSPRSQAREDDDDGPTVTVAVDRRTVDGVEWVSLRVGDDGPGLHPDERAVLTDEAEITPLNHGSGLGLWVVRWVVESLDGSMAIDEGPDGGTLVELRLRPAES